MKTWNTRNVHAAAGRSALEGRAGKAPRHAAPGLLHPAAELRVRGAHRFARRRELRVAAKQLDLSRVVD